MIVAADSGSFETAHSLRRGPVPAARLVADELLARLVGAPGSIIVLPIVGGLLIGLIGLILITAGCGPPN